MSYTAQGASAPAIFSFDSHAVRAINRDGEIWFVASDVAAALEYRDAEVATRYLDDDEKGYTDLVYPSGAQSVIIINESGLYSLILKSRKQEAKRFKKWVTAEVLPAIRKTGGYQRAGQLAAVSALDTQPVSALTREAIDAQLSRVLAPAMLRWETHLREAALAAALAEFAVADLSALSEGDARRVLERLSETRSSATAWQAYRQAIAGEWERAYGISPLPPAISALSKALPEGRYLVDVSLGGCQVVDARGCTLVEAERMARMRSEMEAVAQLNRLLARRLGVLAGHSDVSCRELDTPLATFAEVISG
ncbi:BRO-N domain-containing protein [Crenobacter caeni]|uniref:Bro-N domain-containing protein n=1 Tax=Crenobacter caeni TaxID=2705474 RepID=A0A6B2KNC3_9NEIS|nr:Bro-N domain-containing protein [Crenobacter caeni]NDV11658.1 hypothetical protein [Crenobacter caeni]